jgi:hypothetical protein
MTSIVYQYTDATAFNGVVENKVIWATDYRYLNDAQELVQRELTALRPLRLATVDTCG